MTSTKPSSTMTSLETASALCVQGWWQRGARREVDGMFGRRGVQAYLMEGAVGELQEAAQEHLSKLSGRLTLRLSTVR